MSEYDNTNQPPNRGTEYRGIVRAINKAQTKRGQPYDQVECIDGKKFNVFGRDAGMLFPSALFTCTLEKDGDYLNVSDLVVDMSSKRDMGATNSPPPADDRQIRIELQSERRDLISMLGTFKSPTEDRKGGDYPHEYTKVQARHRLGQVMIALSGEPPVAGQIEHDQETDVNPFE